MTSSFRKKLYDSLEVDAVFFNSKYQLGDILGLAQNINPAPQTKVKIPKKMAKIKVFL